MTHRTKARSPDLNLVSQLMDSSVTNIKPKAQQEAGPDDHSFQDFSSSAL